MSDTSTNTTAKINYAQRNKIALKDLGDPDIIKSKPIDLKSFNMGTLIGMASSVITRKNPKTDEDMEGLGGMFRTLPAPELTALGHEPLESGTLFIPDAFHNMVAAQLREGQKTDPNFSVRFKFEVNAIRATNPQGRSWEFRPVGQFAGVNPLDALEAEYHAEKKLIAANQGAANTKQIAGKK